MEIIWVLYLIVCNNTQCVKQVVDTHDTLALCEEGQVFYKQMPLDSNSMWKTVEYKCVSVTPSGYEGTDA
jgi:hypothetical protein